MRENAIYQATEVAKFDGAVVNRKLPDGTWGVYGPAEVVVADSTVPVLNARTGRASPKYVTEVVRTSTARGRKMAFARTGTAPAAVQATESDGCRWIKTIDGQWAVMGPRDVVVPGVTVSVTKRSGEVQSVTLGSHVEHDVDDAGHPIALAAPAPKARNTSARSGKACAECGHPGRHLTECRDSSGISGMCCSRCAAGPDYTRSFC